MKIKHTQLHEITIGSQRIGFSFDGSEVAFDKPFKVPVEQLPGFLKIISTTAGLTNGSANGAPKRVFQRKGFVSAKARLRWNQKYRGPAKENFARKNSKLAQVSTAAQVLMGRDVFSREILEKRISEKTKLSAPQVSTAVSHLIHDLKMLEVVV